MKNKEELPKEMVTKELLQSLAPATGFELQMIGENFFLEDPYLAGHNIAEGTIEARTYSMRAITRLKDGSSLCILPTAKGKTYIAIALMALQAEHEGKIIYTTPTKVLTKSNMHRIQKILPHLNVGLILGNTSKRERFRIWNESKIICMTPQTLERATDKNFELGDLSDVRHVHFDEVENFRGRYSYVLNVEYYEYLHKLRESLGKYNNTIEYHAYTGVVSSDLEKTRFIWESLEIPFEKIFARKENDPDILPYGFKKNVSFVPIAYSPDALVNEIRHLYISELNRSAKWLHKSLPYAVRHIIGYDHKKEKYTGIKHTMIDSTRNYLLDNANDIGKDSGRMITGLYFIDRLNKILDKIRNEGLFGLKEMLVDTYIQSIGEGKKKPTKNIIALWKSEFNIEAVKILWKIGVWEDSDPWPQNIEKPELRNANWKEDLQDSKLYALANILIKHECHKKTDKKTLVFILDRDHIKKIKEFVEIKFTMLSSGELVGSNAKRNRQKMNLAQQLEALDKFGSNKINILISTSVGMTGLNFPSVDQVVFMEPLGYTELLNQGIGRTGRHADGWAYILYYHNNKKEMLTVRKIISARKAMDDIIDYLKKLSDQHFDEKNKKPLL